MAPRGEFILTSLLAATGLLVAIVLLLDIDRRMPGMREMLATLKLVPAVWLATGLGAWCVIRWHGRALRLGRRWAPGGMTLRTLLIVFYGSMIAVVFGAVPAFILEYFVTRRYLRRLAGITTGQS